MGGTKQKLVIKMGVMTKLQAAVLTGIYYCFTLLPLADTCLIIYHGGGEEEGEERRERIVSVSMIKF